MTARTTRTTAATAALLTALVVASVLVAGVPAAGATSAVITVDDDEGAAAYQSIAAAVDAAESGDTIRVRPGTYEGTVTVGKSLTIVGAAGDDERGPRADAPVVRAGDGPAFRLTSGATGASIRGFVLEGNLSVAPRGNLQYVTVSDNRFVDGSLAVSLADESGLSVSDVTVERNVFEGGGVVVDGTAPGLHVEDVTVSENAVTDSPGTGIAVDVAADQGRVGLSVTGNDVEDASGDGVAVSLAATDRATVFVEGNRITGSADAGVALADRDAGPRVYVRNNRVADGATGIALRRTDRVTAYWIRDNNVVGNDRGVTTSTQYLDVRENYWGDADGPASASGTALDDPFDDATADGDGDTVPEGREKGVAAVRFAPYRSGSATVEAVGPPGNDEDGSASFRIDERVLAEDAVAVGENVTAVVTVTNTGGQVGTYDAILTDDTRTNLDSASARVQPGETRSLLLQTTYDSPGARRLFVRGNYVGAIEVVDRPATEVLLTPTDDGVRFQVENARVGEDVTVDPDADGPGGVDAVTIAPRVSGDFEGRVGPATGDDANRSLPTGVRDLGRASVTSTLDDDDVDAVTVRFAVDPATLDANASALSLYRAADDGWRESDVSVVSENDSAVVFEATTDGFGTLALGADAPAFTVTDATLDANETTVGETVTVTATVRNDGRADGDGSVALALDGETVADETVSAAAGANATVTFEYSPETAGTYNVSVGGVDAGTLTVAEGDGTTTTTDDGTTTTSDGTTTTTDDGTTTGDTDTTTGDGSSTTTSGPGFGVTAAVVALAAAALLARRRR